MWHIFINLSYLFHAFFVVFFCLTSVLCQAPPHISDAIYVLIQTICRKTCSNLYYINVRLQMQTNKQITTTTKMSQTFPIHFACNFCYLTTNRFENFLAAFTNLEEIQKSRSPNNNGCNKKNIRRNN